LQKAPYRLNSTQRGRKVGENEFYNRHDTGTAYKPCTQSVTTQTTDSNDTSEIFKNVKAVSGVAIPKLLVALGLFPDSGVTGYGNDRFWARNNGERLPFRGSAFFNPSDSGPSALYLIHPRSSSDDYVGFRSAFVE